MGRELHCITGWHFTRSELVFMLTMQRHLNVKKTTDALGWKPESARTYTNQIRRKMGVRSMLEAIVIFDRWTEANSEVLDAIKLRFGITI